jgi:hypothetical protein
VSSAIGSTLYEPQYSESQSLNSSHNSKEGAHTAQQQMLAKDLSF